MNLPLVKCYKCGVKFIKLDGCNMMTCSCGAKMCYVCGQQVKNYEHFNKRGRCPLSSNLDRLHGNAVMKGAEQAKIEIGVKSDPNKLKHDPAADINKFYKMVKNTKGRNNFHNPRRPHGNNR